MATELDEVQQLSGKIMKVLDGNKYNIAIGAIAAVSSHLLKQEGYGTLHRFISMVEEDVERQFRKQGEILPIPKFEVKG